MEVNVINNIPNINVVINKSENGCSILIEEKNKKILGDVCPGETVKLGNRDYIVLEQRMGETAVITKDFVKEMKFGDSNDYRKSEVRKYCNEDFYEELCLAVGKENIIKHTVNLIADDGTNKGVSCEDNVSILTTGLYRRYREYLPAYGNWWRTATPVSADISSVARGVCCVDSDGVLCWNGCGGCNGVRPFCILKSSILVS